MSRCFLAATILLLAVGLALPHGASAQDIALELHAYNINFDAADLSVASGANVTLTLHNDDERIAHSLALDLPGSEPSHACIGPCEVSLSFVAPASGAYKLYCSFHTAMIVNLHVQ